MIESTSLYQCNVCNVLVRSTELEKHIENCPPCLPTAAQQAAHPSERPLQTQHNIQQPVVIKDHQLPSDETLFSMHDDEAVRLLQQQQQQRVPAVASSTKSTRNAGHLEADQVQAQIVRQQKQQQQQQASGSSNSRFLPRNSNNSAQPKRSAQAARAHIAQSQVNQPAVAFGTALNMSGLEFQVDSPVISAREPRSNMSSVRGNGPSIAVSLEKAFSRTSLDEKLEESSQAVQKAQSAKINLSSDTGSSKIGSKRGGKAAFKPAGSGGSGGGFPLKPPVQSTPSSRAGSAMGTIMSKEARDERYDARKQQSLQRAMQQKFDKEKRECTFVPTISARAASYTFQEDITDLLYEDAVQRKDRKLHLEEISDFERRQTSQIAPLLLANDVRVHRFAWAKLSREVRIEFGKVTNNCDVLREHQLIPFLAGLGCLPKGWKRMCQNEIWNPMHDLKSTIDTLWKMLDHDVDGCVDFTDVAIFMGILFNDVREDVLLSRPKNLLFRYNDCDLTSHADSCMDQLLDYVGESHLGVGQELEAIAEEGSQDGASPPAVGVLMDQTHEEEPCSLPSSQLGQPFEHPQVSSINQHADKVSLRIQLEERIGQCMSSFEVNHVRKLFQCLLDYRRYNVPDSKKKLESLSETDPEASFEPEINPNSDLYYERIKQDISIQTGLHPDDVTKHDVDEWWALRTQRKKMELKKFVRMEELAGCTFQPNISSSRRHVDSQKGEPAEDEGDLIERLHSKHEKHLQKRDKAIAARKVEATKEELQGCTFKPDTSKTKNFRGIKPLSAVRGLDKEALRMRRAREQVKEVKDLLAPRAVIPAKNFSKTGEPPSCAYKSTASCKSTIDTPGKHFNIGDKPKSKSAYRAPRSSSISEKRFSHSENRNLGNRTRSATPGKKALRADLADRFRAVEEKFEIIFNFHKNFNTILMYSRFLFKTIKIASISTILNFSKFA